MNVLDKKSEEKDDVIVWSIEQGKKCGFSIATGGRL